MEEAIAKSFSFRFFATIGTFLVAWLVTSNPVEGFGIAITQGIVNTFIYYLHEKHWTQIKTILDKFKYRRYH